MPVPNVHLHEIISCVPVFQGAANPISNYL